MVRPRIKIELEPFDRFIEAVGFFALLLLIGIPIYYYNDLPEIIPRHFDADGTPDGYSGKNIIWLLPAIGTVISLSMYWLSKRPHIYNYTQKITEENAYHQYRNAARMIRVMSTLIVSVFAYLCSTTIMTALGEQEGIGPLFTPIFLLLIFGSIGYFLYQATKK